MLEPSWIGRRVTVRRVLAHTPEGRPQFGDVVGDLVGLNTDTAVLDTRTGRVEVATAAIAIARLAPPSTADELALEAVAAAGWRAEETAELGGWLLRATGGFTGRANSVLPLRPPGMPLGDALQRARSWYAERGLPLRLLVPREARRLLDAELSERGWAAGELVHTMAARLDWPDAPSPGVEIAALPDDGWLHRYREGAGAAPTAHALLTRHDLVAFASVRTHGRVVAIGRGTVDDGWLGITAVEVDPALRRSGLARSVTAALRHWGAEHGATRSYLQVRAANVAAVTLYESEGYWVHHDYRYRFEPVPDGLR